MNKIKSKALLLFIFVWFLCLSQVAVTFASWNAHNITATSADIYCSSAGFNETQYQLKHIYAIEGGNIYGAWGPTTDYGSCSLGSTMTLSGLKPNTYYGIFAQYIAQPGYPCWLSTWGCSWYRTDYFTTLRCPSTVEICGDGIDNNCDGQIDEGCCADNDGDGYYGYNRQSCTQGNDCNDNNPLVNLPSIWYKDIDDDKYSDGATTTQCEQPAGYKLSSDLTATSGDCDDNDPNKNPQTIWYKDSDGDGYSDRTTLTQCEQATGYKLSSELTSQEYDCNDNNPLVNLPSIWYKDTDNDGYTDGTTMTSCTRPSGYRPQSELQSTSGDNKDDDGSIYPGAPEICGDNKDNNQNGQTDESCCNASVSVSPNEVWPKNAGNDSNTTSTITISLTTPARPEGCTVNLSVEIVNLSGGHNHGGTRPKGTLSDYSFSLYNWEPEKTALYTSSEVSGEEKIKVKLNNNDAGELAITVRVPNLEGLGSSGDFYFVLRGGTNTHPEGSYGTPATLEELMMIAKEYFRRTGGKKLSVNDISLPMGGLFDYNATWAPPHNTHRTGTDADINRQGVDCYRDEKLKQAVRAIANGQRRPYLQCENTQGRPVPQDDLTGVFKHIDFD